MAEKENMAHHNQAAERADGPAGSSIEKGPLQPLNNQHTVSKLK